MLKRINIPLLLAVVFFALMLLAIGFVEERPVASAVCTGLMLPVTYLINRESGKKKK